MVIDEIITINKSLSIRTPGEWFQFCQKTTAERNAMIAAGGGWSTYERGRIWFNTDSEQLEMFNGSSIVLLG